MRVSSETSETLSKVLDDHQTEVFAGIVEEDSVVGWSMIGADGATIASDGVSQSMSGVCADVLAMAGKLGKELGEDAPRPRLTFAQTRVEVFTLPVDSATIVVMRDKTSGYHKEIV